MPQPLAPNTLITLTEEVLLLLSTNSWHARMGPSRPSNGQSRAPTEGAPTRCG